MEEKGIRKGKKDRPGSRRWEVIIERNLVGKSSAKRDKIFASTAGLCARQTAGLSMLPASSKETMRASTQFYFSLGSTFEKLVGEAFEKADILIDSETRVEGDHLGLPISGRIDFVVRDPKDSRLVLVELKSCGKLPTKPKHPHLAQLMVYLCLTGMPKGIVWYISRSVANWKGVLQQVAFEVEPTDEERKQTIKTMALGVAYLGARSLPEIPANMKRYKCGFCSLVPMCWEGEDLGIVTKELSVPKSKDVLRQAITIAKNCWEVQHELREEFESVMVEPW